MDARERTAKPSSTVARERHQLLWLADKAEAVFLDAARAVPRSQEVQLVHHVVVATHEGTIDPGCLEDRQFERSFQEPSADPVVDKNDIASCEAHREGAPGM